MKKGLATILIAFVGLTVVFILVGGAFDKLFWLAFLPGLMANLAILFVAVFVIDRIFQKERWSKLGRVNARQSQLVRFLINRVAYWLLEHLDLANEEDLHKDKTLNFDFAIAELRAIDLAERFYEKLMGSADKEAFVDTKRWRSQ